MGKTTTDSVAGTANDQTIINRNFPTGSITIVVNAAAGKRYRISGITFGQVAGIAAQNGYLTFSGQSQTVRLDHCHFALATKGQGQVIRIDKGVYGVADHNVIEHPRDTTFYIANGNQGTSTWGHGAWAQPSGWGGSQFFFIEDNYVKNVSKAISVVTDGVGGCKFAAVPIRVADALTSSLTDS